MGLDSVQDLGVRLSVSSSGEKVLGLVLGRVYWDDGKESGNYYLGFRV